MPGTESYHSQPQFQRIQKRLVLNQAFRDVHVALQQVATINYVTYGGLELADALDLVSVFDVRRHRINIISYEEDDEVAERSRKCAVAATLSKINTIKIDIVPTAFLNVVEPLTNVRPEGPAIYFLDDTRTFGVTQTASLTSLLTQRLLTHGDWLLITSCLTPRVVHQGGFMREHETTFQLYFALDRAPQREFKVRNHVDLLVRKTFSGFERVGRSFGDGQHLLPVLVRKFRYRDTRAAMGLWLYRIDRSRRPTTRCEDVNFEEFPVAFQQVSEAAPRVPNIFD